MKFDKDFLEEKFREYYDKNRTVVTHIFTYSPKKAIHKEEMMDNDPIGYEFMKVCHVNGVEYTEMRSRDASILEFGWGDETFVCVGTYKDITR